MGLQAGWEGGPVSGQIAKNIIGQHILQCYFLEWSMMYLAIHDSHIFQRDLGKALRSGTLYSPTMDTHLVVCILKASYYMY